MIRSSHFAFVATIVVAILLLTGNLVTPVPANSTYLVTSTPNGTPIAETNGQDDQVAAEQQEELKSVINSYFEIRYNALSITQPEGFQLQGFGNLVSDAADAKAFLDAELSRLAVEISRAELYDLKYVDYKYFLDFVNFSVDASTQKATVSLIEENDVIYESVAASTQEGEAPIVSHLYNREHKITLRQEQGQWKIVLDDYNDHLWRMLRHSGKSTEEMINVMEASLVSESQSQSAETATLQTLPPDASSHTYNRTGARDYAIDHINVYNEDYPNYHGQILGGDCTNFVSQSLYEGGNVSMYIPPGPLPPPSPNGQSGWYLLNDFQRATDWNDVTGFYNFVSNPGAPTEGPEGMEVATIGELMLGDVIQFEWPPSKDDTDNIWDHAVIIVGFDGSGNPLVASHSDDFGPGPYASFAPWQAIRYIHIERSDGYPPIKVQTTSAADDAGGNPGGACPITNSDPNNNYLGGCFNGGQGIASGFLFRNVQIPQGAQIKYAYVNFTTDGTYGVIQGNPGQIYAPISLLIYGENTATPANFTPTNTPGHRTNLITPAVPWPINRTDNQNNIAYDTWVWKGKRTTPAVTSIIQTITGLNGWASGNTLSLIFHNAEPFSTIYARRVLAYESTTAINANYSPARLIAAYDLPALTDSQTFPSLASQDGWILESTESSGVGGSNNASATSFNLGDSNADKQYRSILHFNTSGLPENAIITSVTLQIKQQGSITGTNPFTTHGSLVADIRQPYFGTAGSLANGDFQAAAGQSAIATFAPTPVNGWYTAVVNSSAFSQINLAGTTQFRLAFTLDDNDDMSADFILFSSGNDGTAANRPQLIVEYYEDQGLLVPTP